MEKKKFRNRPNLDENICTSQGPDFAAQNDSFMSGHVNFSSILKNQVMPSEITTEEAQMMSFRYLSSPSNMNPGD
jgi:hypothetical protein